MKIHEKDASSFPAQLNKRRRLSKRKSVEEEGEQADEPSNKKVQLHPCNSMENEYIYFLFLNK